MAESYLPNLSCNVETSRFVFHSGGAARQKLVLGHMTSMYFLR